MRRPDVLDFAIIAGIVALGYLLWPARAELYAWLLVAGQEAIAGTLSVFASTSIAQAPVLLLVGVVVLATVTLVVLVELLPRTIGSKPKPK